MMGSMRPYLEMPEAISPQRRRQLLSDFEESLLIGTSPLTGTFQSTRGVAWTLTHEGILELLHQSPWLQPGLEALNIGHNHHNFTPWYNRWTQRPFNAFYLNLLQVAPGPGVGAHIDTTLREATGLEDLFPEQVSVLWLDIPSELEGGNLSLFNNDRVLACLAPSNGKVIHFGGRLNHQITSISLRPQSPVEPAPLRTSLVCEQYRLPASALQKLPPLSRHSRGTFPAYLNRAHQQPLKTFALD